MEGRRLSQESSLGHAERVAQKAQIQNYSKGEQHDPNQCYTTMRRASTRRSLVRILTDSVRLDDFKRNPQEFIELATESVNRTKRLALVDGIKYQRIGDEHYYVQELFEHEELTGYLKNMLAATKSVYEQVVYDSSGVERTFAEQLEKNEAVKVYAKLPGWFKVPTPLGTYRVHHVVLRLDLV